ncbi:hypothetical protein GCM10029976_090700 [Kribbella albertanoniae]|uniref:Uncharacterized protein n=1 Tax=Kribbella albertanoniae TaxID=1266829 RepID=A0A4R4PJA6_9ACTN|nr:hypothetical protein [Kribbella albertanoniae]TDC22140.1 hypothetical protein E1261_31620 [Kribbella albertanoniae]
MTDKPDESWRVVLLGGPDGSPDGSCKGRGDKRDHASCEATREGHIYVLPDDTWWHVRCYHRHHSGVRA